MQFRGFMLDSARCLENRAYYRRWIRFAAQRGINVLLWHFTDDQGCTLGFDSVPGVASPHAYSKDEMRSLIAFARRHGITVIPELASLGHCRYLTNLPAYRHLDEVEQVFTSMCPVAPETRQVLAQLIEETAQVFDAPWFHIGLDEANIGHHPLTRQALQRRTRGEIVADHVNYLHECVRAQGRTMMMWGDGLLKDRQVTPHLSRQIIICDWQYGSAITGESVQYFLDEGFPVVLCPALISHNQTLFPGDQLALANLRTLLPQIARRGKGQVMGVIETVWQPERYMHDAMWMGMDLAAALMRDGPEISVKACIARFAKEFHGFTPPAEWVEACRQVYRLSPLRKEWLAVAKMERDQLPPELVSARAVAWQICSDALARQADQVRSHSRAYSTYQLMVRLMAHLYRKTELLQAGAVPPAEAQRIVQQEERLVEQVEAVWDRERFGDDPRKHTPPRECFRDNHLTILLRSGLEKTRQLLQVQAKVTVQIARRTRPSRRPRAIAAAE